MDNWNIQLWFVIGRIIIFIFWAVIHLPWAVWEYLLLPVANFLWRVWKLLKKVPSLVKDACEVLKKRSDQYSKNRGHNQRGIFDLKEKKDFPHKKIKVK